MQYLCDVVAHSPLTLRFSFLNPPDAHAAVNVPRVIGPYGVFLRATIKDSGGRVVTEPPSLRATHKLPADSAASYLELQPGYSFGAMFVVDDAPSQPGAYRMTVEYSNGPYRGAAGVPVGELAFKKTFDFEVPGR